MALNNHNPRVLIISRNFQAGDAITTLNLFSKFNKTDLYCISMSESTHFESFKETYILGNREIFYKFPFNYIEHPNDSHLQVHLPQFQSNQKRNNIKNQAYVKLLRPTLQWLDLYDSRYSIHLSKELCNWIEKIKPDVIYTSVGDISMALFIIELHNKYPYIKVAIHGFDDWLTPSYNICNVSRHKKKAELLLNTIIDFATYRFTSSEKMALEYHDRYKHRFKCFPNPTRIINEQTPNYINSNKVIFTGKVAWHNAMAIKETMIALQQLQSIGIKLEFEIYSMTAYDEIRNFLGEIPENTKIYGAIPNNQIPSLLLTARILLLPISINCRNEKFTRYSMSTKIGEYLSSGVPTLYIGPRSIAMTEFLNDKKCAFIVDTPGCNSIRETILEMIRDSSEESKRCHTGKSISTEYFDIEKVATDFKDSIYALI